MFMENRHTVMSTIGSAAGMGILLYESEYALFYIFMLFPASTVYRRMANSTGLPDAMTNGV
jgi:hypothetical protein